MTLPRTRPAALALTLALAGVALLGACRGTVRLAESDADVVLARHALAAPDPGMRGPFAVRTLYYGSGTDRNRPAYRDSVTLRTDSVDASLLVDLGTAEKQRNGYWGFTSKGFPVNGRVWYPEGDGPFPLVLVVHGNHNPRDFSDPGYDYLGELLASRGYILASVDMNFINGLRNENDGRGWMLLQHLRAWRTFDGAVDGPFRGKVDLTRIALMGHSRGGEAVAHAAAFNRLKHYPDDASLTFDFGFDIRALVAIAPVDGQYLPTGRGVPVDDVSYLVFHGSHDGDVTSFQGLRQYDRVRFTGGRTGFKTAVYVYRANHGQWNSVWGARDVGPRSGRTLDLRGLLAPAEQRRFAEVYVSAFLEATLRDDDRWLPLFRDHRVAADWLPRTMYVTRFESSGFRPLATFEEDIDVTTGTEQGVRLAGDSLETWREGELALRSRNNANTAASQENQGVWLAWSPVEAGRDSAAAGTPPAAEVDSAAAGEAGGGATPHYTLTLPEGLAGAWGVDGSWSLELALAPTDRTPRARADSARRGRRARSAAEAERDRAAEDEGRDAGEAGPMDLSVEVEDAHGRVARVALSAYGPVRRPLETHVLRRSDLEEARFAEPWELVLQSYSIPLSDFAEATPGLEPRALRQVRLVFDRTRAGEFVLDEVGLARLPAAFWSARVSGSPR